MCLKVFRVLLLWPVKLISFYVCLILQKSLKLLNQRLVETVLSFKCIYFKWIVKVQVLRGST